MTPNPPSLDRLLALARRGRPTPTDAESKPVPPPGFTTRVAARWAAGGVPIAPSPADLWERLAWWGSGVAVATCLIVLATQATRPAPSTVELLLDSPAIEAPL